MDSEYGWTVYRVCRYRYRKRLQGIAGFLLATILCAAGTHAAKLAVIYPEIREPYLQVFVSIAEGVAHYSDVKVLTLATNTTITSADIDAWLQQHQIDGMVALGNSGITLANDLPGSRPTTVIGAAIINPGNTQFSGISLNPAPEKLFQLAKVLRPSLRRIHVVFEPDYNQWGIEAAADRAAALELELVSYPVADMRQAATTYRKVQDNLDRKTEALWLPMGGPSRDKALLQTLLETAWSREQMIFSSSLSDVRRGALFALYPDNEAMGAALAALLERKRQAPTSPLEILFVSTLLQAINIRTADHLGLRFSRQELEDFDFIYPPP